MRRQHLHVCSIQLFSKIVTCRGQDGTQVRPYPSYIVASNNVLMLFYSTDSTNIASWRGIVLETLMKCSVVRTPEVRLLTTTLGTKLMHSPAPKCLQGHINNIPYPHCAHIEPSTTACIHIALVWRKFLTVNYLHLEHNINQIYIFFFFLVDTSSLLHKWTFWTFHNSYLAFFSLNPSKILQNLHFSKLKQIYYLHASHFSQ